MPNPLIEQAYLEDRSELLWRMYAWSIVAWAFIAVCLVRYAIFGVQEVAVEAIPMLSISLFAAHFGISSFNRAYGLKRCFRRHRCGDYDSYDRCVSQIKPTFILIKTVPPAQDE